MIQLLKQNYKWLYIKSILSISIYILTKKKGVKRGSRWLHLYLYRQGDESNRRWISISIRMTREESQKRDRAYLGEDIVELRVNRTRSWIFAKESQPSSLIPHNLCGERKICVVVGSKSSLVSVATRRIFETFGRRENVLRWLFLEGYAFF